MSKENRPAFMFYASDWLTSTAFMDAETRGMYINLLSYQWVNGELPNDLPLLARLAGVDSASSTATSKLQALIKQKFKHTASTCLINEKLERVREKAVATAANLSERGRKGAIAKQANARRKQDFLGDSEPINEDNGAIKNSAYDGACEVLGEYEYKDGYESENRNEIRGVQGGNGRSLSKPTFDVSKFARDFAREYGIAGKIAANERAMAQAVISIRARDGTMTDEGLQLFLLSQAKKSKEYDQRRQSHRLNPDTWLDERQYEVDFDEAMANYKPHRKEEKAQIYDRLNSEEPRF